MIEIGGDDIRCVHVFWFYQLSEEVDFVTVVSQDEQSDSRILLDPSGKLSDFIGSDGNSSEVVGILGIGFRQEVVGCWKVPEWPGSCRNPENPPLSDIRQLPVGIQYQGFRRIPTNSHRI